MLTSSTQDDSISVQVSLQGQQEDSHNNDNEVDEHQEFITCRTVSAMSSYYNFLGYENYPRPSPAVVVIKVRSDDFLNENNALGKTCHLEVYMHRPEHLNNLKFVEFFKDWDYDTALIVVNVRDKTIYVYRKTDNSIENDYMEHWR